jgi:hypothetical protein
MRHLLLLPVVLWFIFLLWGVLVIEERRKSAPALSDACSSREAKSLEDSYVAIHDMPSNYRLFVKDLLWDSKLGKHLGCSVRAGDPVKLSDLRYAPKIQPRAEKKAYLISLRAQPALALMVNTGSKIDIWRDFEPVLHHIPVLALLCDDIPGTDCSAVLEVSDKEMETLWKGAGQKLQILISSIQS